MRYISYRRVSTSEQSESGLGMAAQAEAIRKTISAEPDLCFVDEGISGKRADRPGLLAALDALKRGDVLVTAKRDRLSRDMFLMLWIEKEVKKRGASITSAAGEGTDGDGPTDILLRRVVDAFSEFERGVIAQRTRAALQAKKARGEKCGGEVRFGFNVDADGRLIPNPVEQEIISRIKELREAGFSLRSIANALNAEGFTTRRGTAWKHQYVASIVKAA